MGMTMTQKILAKHANLDHVVAGQLIEANLDLVLGNDITTPVAINEFKKINPNIRTYLGASKGKESFYEKFGFVSRPNEELGSGMILY